MAAYYNEIDPYAAAWLRNLIREGLIADGEVDERDIRDVRPVDLIGYDQCHFFAGIGGWSYALRLAGWPDDRPVWTGSCPCQPFSAAGKGEGFADERHLWPYWFHLIGVHQPATVFGEQVASKHALAWLDLVSSDLEGAGYAVGAVDLPACGVGAPHIRNRLWFVADRDAPGRGLEPGARLLHGERAAHGHDADGRGLAGELADRDGARRGEGRSGEVGDGRDAPRLELAGLRAAGELADAERRPAERRGHGMGAAPDRAQEETRKRQRVRDDAWAGGDAGDVDHADDAGPQGRCLPEADRGRDGAGERTARAPGPVNGFWSGADWLPCRDGKARPVEPGTFPLAHGVPNRVGRLRAYGNAIVPQVAAEFIKACRP